MKNDDKNNSKLKNSKKRKDSESRNSIEKVKKPKTTSNFNGKKQKIEIGTAAKKPKLSAKQKRAKQLKRQMANAKQSNQPKKKSLSLTDFLKDL